MTLELGSKLHTLLVEYNAALIARAKSDRLTFSVYDVQGKRFVIMDSGGAVGIFAPVPASPPGDAVDTLRKLLADGAQ
jgi:hypothetical protein